jgi:hypothetical protein
MKQLKSVLIFLVILLSSFATFANEDVFKSPYFDAAKVYQSKDLVLNDTLEFIEFDISDVQFVNASKDILQAGSNSKKKISALDESTGNLGKLPKIFYQSLKKQIHLQEAPLTLYSNNSPGYANPLQLKIKIKSIHLDAHSQDELGQYQQPIRIRIFGELIDKKSKTTLVKFYDSAKTNFVLGNNNAAKTYENLSQTMMEHLALYLRAQY